MSAGTRERAPRGPAAPAAWPRRVLLVTGSIGAGHHAAARAVEERARQVWPGVEVAWTDTLDGMGRHTGALFQAVYAGCVRRLPWLYELYFRLLWRVPPFRAATRAVIGAWSAPGLARQLARHDPDLVVATFPEGVTGLARLRRRGRLPVPAVALVTDPAPHPLWADAGLDLHLVSTAPGAALLERAAPGAAVRIAALPVAARFHPPDGTADRERPRVYVSCGSLAFGDLAATCAAVLDAGADRRHGVGTTVLLLAAVAEALHGLLAERGAAPRGGTVRAMVPMTTRTGAAIGSRAPGNRTAVVAVDLPTGAMPPAERVARVARAVADGAGGGQPEGAAAVLALLGLLPGRLQALVVRAVYGHRFFHVLASVMPGVRRPLYLRGALVREAYPVLPLAEGVGLAVGALHWGATTGVGITADPHLVPEWAQLPERLAAALALIERAP